MSNSQIALIKAYLKGYRVIGSKVFLNGRERSLSTNKHGYYYFSIRVKGDLFSQVMVHRLVAFEKFGHAMFAEGIQVRHLNGNPLDNSPINILIGTASENSMDRLYSVRRMSAIKAAYAAKKHNHESIIALYNSTKSYKAIMYTFGIRSKGTINFILKKSIASEISPK